MSKCVLVIILVICAIAACFGQTVKSVALGSGHRHRRVARHRTVTLSAVAKSGGLKVILKSTSPYASVSASVTVPAGVKTATFTITTTVVPEKETAFVTASADSSSASAELTIVPPTVTALAIAPSSVICQQPATGTVTINVAAGSNGFNVALKSSQMCASVPAVVNVPKGATIASFTITTSVVTQATVATITASGGGTATATLTVLPGNGLSPSGWSKFLANASNTPQGLHPAAKGQIAMTVDVFSGPQSPPAVGPDGTVYVIESTYDVKLRALNPNGSTKWTIELPANGQLGWRNAPVVAAGGTIYVLSASELYAISPLGKTLWSRSAGSYPAIDSHGVLYVGGQGGYYGTSVTAITSAGTVKWTTNVPGAAQPTVGADGNIYVGSTAGLTKLTAGGAIVWSKAFRQDNLGGGESFLLADGSIVVWNGTGTGTPLEAANFTTAGELRWTYDFGPVYGVTGYAANPKGGLYAFDWAGTLTSVSPNGARLWTKELPGDIGGGYSVSAQTLTVNGAGDVFAADGNGKLWAFTPSGGVKWSCQMGDGTSGGESIAANGTVYISALGEHHSSPAGGSLYAVDANGTLNWAHYGSYIYSIPSFGLDGTAYFAGGGGISAFDRGGNLKWCYGNTYFGNHYANEGGPIATQPTIGSDGTVYYTSQDGFRALTSAGNLKWFYPYTPTASSQVYWLIPAIGPDGTIYIADRNLIALNPNGTLKWSKSYADWLIAICPAISPDGTLHIISQGQTGPQAIYAIASDGTLLSTTVQAAPWLTISLDQKGNLYTIILNSLTMMNPSGEIMNTFGGTTSTWYVVGADGTVCYRDSATNNIVLAGGYPMGSDWDPFAMATDDTIYGVTQTGGTVRAYNNAGQLLWALPGASAWTAQYGLFPHGPGFVYSSDRPMSIAPDGGLWVFSGYGFTVIK